MAISNSYKDNSPRTFQFLKDIVGEAYPQTMGLGTIDSSDTAAPHIENMVQRAGENIGDLSGKVYNSTGGVITLVEVQYSQVSVAGPWYNVTVLNSDAAYIFPNGTPAGEAFNVPFELSGFTGDTWMRIEISY